MLFVRYVTLTLQKNKTLISVFSHFSGRYDTNFVLQGISNQETYIISKPCDNFVSVKVTGTSDEHKKFSLNFVDSLNFLSTFTEKLVESLKKTNHIFKMMTCSLKKQGYTDKLIKMLFRKGIFPYEYQISQDVIQETSPPPKD